MNSWIQEKLKGEPLRKAMKLSMSDSGTALIAVQISASRKQKMVTEHRPQ